VSPDAGVRRLFRPWPAVPVAFAAALSGQVLLLVGRVAPGAALYFAAAVLLLGQQEESDGSPGEDLAPERAILALLAVLACALALRTIELGSIPWGLNNDEGIEGLIACRFLSGEKIAPFSSIGLSRETLYHVLLIPLFRLLGPGIPALRLLSLLSALATLPVLYWTGKEFFSVRVGVLSAALMAFSPWHLLYSRTGLRNILLPWFVLAALGSFHRALRRRKLVWFLFTGAILGIGMYSYTSFRVVPAALLTWAMMRRLLFRRPRMAWKETFAVLFPFLFLMAPQIEYAVGHPADFLARGGYVLTQTPRASLSANVFYSFLMPVIYPARYGVMQSFYYFGDGVSLVYSAVGRTPETAISGAVMACGFLLALSRFLRRRAEAEAVLLLCLALTIATVGIAGPSLTRLIGYLPLLCLAGGAFLEETGRVLGRRFSPAAGSVLVLLILASAGFLCYEQYFLRAGSSRKAMFYYAAPETVMGLYAVGRPTDRPVYVLYTEEPETLEFLTFPRRSSVILERDPSRLDLARIRGVPLGTEFVIENNPRFAELVRKLGEAFPAAEVGYLPDRRHPSEGDVAFLLRVAPGAGRATPGSSPPGEPSLPSSEPPTP
jgi:4-amino-4-deoxy-L-arabinose transferase-like glycosyltransferase